VTPAQRYAEAMRDALLKAAREYADASDRGHETTSIETGSATVLFLGATLRIAAKRFRSAERAAGQQ
jgi:hypothetical protein